MIQLQKIFFCTSSVYYHLILEDIHKDSIPIFLDLQYIEDESEEDESKEDESKEDELKEDESSESYSVIDLRFIDVEKKYHIAETSLLFGTSFAIIGVLNFHRARSFEKQMLMESNNYRYNELLQQYNQHRNQYILTIPASLTFTTLGVSLYARRNIQKSVSSQPVDTNQR